MEHDNQYEKEEEEIAVSERTPVLEFNSDRSVGITTATSTAIHSSGSAAGGTVDADAAVQRAGGSQLSASFSFSGPDRMATTMEHSDSVLVDDYDDNNDDAVPSAPPAFLTRSNTAAYMEKASIEQALLDTPIVVEPPTTTVDHPKQQRIVPQLDNNSASIDDSVDVAKGVVEYVSSPRRQTRRRSSLDGSLRLPDATMGDDTTEDGSYSIFGNQSSDRFPIGDSSTTSFPNLMSSERDFFRAVVPNTKEFRELNPNSPSHGPISPQAPPPPPPLPVPVPTSSYSSPSRSSKRRSLATIPSFGTIEDESALQTLHRRGILPRDVLRNSNADADEEETLALHAIFDGFCQPAISVAACRYSLDVERNHDYESASRSNYKKQQQQQQVQPQHKEQQPSADSALPDQPAINMTVRSTSDDSQSPRIQRSHVVALLQHNDHRCSSAVGTDSAESSSSKIALPPTLFQLPLHFAAAFLRILCRLLSYETDGEYNEACFLSLPWKHRVLPTMDLSKDPDADSDHATKRPHLQYSVARFQCTWMGNMAGSDREDDGMTKVNSQNINKDTPLAVQTILSLWDKLTIDRQVYSPLVAPLARLLGLTATAGVTPHILRRMLTMAQTPLISPISRLTMVRALKVAAAGASRSSLLPNSAPRQFFSFGGTGLQRTISGLSVWPFRNDFGMALWFRAERFDMNSSPTLLSVRTEDGGGIEVSVVPLGEKKDRVAQMTTEACTIAVSIYDSRDRRDTPAHHLVVRSGCVLLPRVWYHLSVRHTRSRLKGVFSLSTRQQLSIMLDGKAMLTESFPFPKVSDTDFVDDSTGSLLKSTLRMNVGHSSMSITLRFGSKFEGQTGALHIFNDNVSDASFRALYEATGGKGSALKRNNSLGDGWDLKRSDLIRKSRVLDVNITNDDAEEIVLSSRRQSGIRKRKATGKGAFVFDLAEGEDQDDDDLPTDLHRSAFGSKVFATWDPRRTSGNFALELHIGAHVRLEGVYAWGISGAQDVISSTGGLQSLVPVFRSFLGGEIERARVAHNEIENRDIILSAISDLLKLLSSFVQDHQDNSRELLRCGGVDVVEQLLHSCKKLAIGKEYTETIFGATNSCPGLVFVLVASMLELCGACSHYVSLETKIYSRLLFNTSLWMCGSSQIPGASMYAVLLPVLSSLTKNNPAKVRDCVGLKDIVATVKELALGSWDDLRHETVANRYLRNATGDCFHSATLNHTERRYATYILHGMIFNVVASGTSPKDLSYFLNVLSSALEDDSESHVDEHSTNVDTCSRASENRKLAIDMSTILLFLFQIRPSISGLYESFAHTCGGVQGGASWILGSMVNSRNDHLRSLGIRCIAAYLDIASRGADLPLVIGSLQQPIEINNEIVPVSSTVRRASSRISQLAKGLVSMGPNARTIVLTPSKLTARVVFKLLWHLLKSHRSSLGRRTHAAIISWITDNEGSVSSSLGSLQFVQEHLIPPALNGQISFPFNPQWAESSLAKASLFVGKSLRNPLAIGTVLRLLRFLESDLKDQLISDFIALTKSNRKCVTMLASIPEWQPCLFSLVSETLESVTSHHSSTSPQPEVCSENSGRYGDVQERLDRCLHLYSVLLGHLLRAGGDQSLEAVERVTALERVFVNGKHVLLLVLSSLCSNLYDEGTLLEVGSLSAEDWKEVDLEQDSLLLKQSARLITDAILSKGTKGLDLTTAVRSWRSLRHLTEVVVAIVAKSGYNVVELFDYVNLRASAIDKISGGLHGIRLPEALLRGVGAAEYVSCLEIRRTSDGKTTERETERRLCVRLASQTLTLLDAFIFPQSMETLPQAQVDGLALVRFSEARLGTAQGPLISSAIRLSFLLLAVLEPCSVVFLQCASRLRCLLCWALELIREIATAEGHVAPFHRDGVAHIDRLVLAVILHCHRALGRCSALLSEIERTSSIKQYFSSRDAQKKYYRRLLRVALELRDVVSAAFRGRNETLQLTLSSEAFEALQSSLEGAESPGKNISKESVVRDFLSSVWVTGFQDTISRLDLSIPEQVCMENIPLSSDQDKNPLFQGFATIEKLAVESSAIVTDFEKAIDHCFEEYLEGQRKWAETDAVRDLEHDGVTTMKRMTENHKSDVMETTKVSLQRRSWADRRWRGIQHKVSDPWRNEAHWKLARYTDLLGRRTLMVQNRHFHDHNEASYDLIMGKEREKEEAGRQRRLLEKQALSDVMRRNAEAFVVTGTLDDAESNDGSSMLIPMSDGDSATDLESSTDGDSVDKAVLEVHDAIENLPLNDIPEEGWDKIESNEIQDVDAEGDGDVWAKAFIWAESEAVVARFEPVMIVSLQTFVEGKILLTTHGLYFYQLSDEINVMTREPLDAGDPAAVDSKIRRWRLTRLTEVHGRRYMLRPQALELFFSDSHELLLNFPGGGKDRDRFHAKMRNSCRIPMLRSPKSLSPRITFRRSKLTELWRKRKLSNFDYLMVLNRMAGRSFNDLTQYPVFPWVLADYTSERIDLTDSRIYRDLSKPVGALNPDRLAQLLERYSELELFGFTEAEKFLYGSHYSSPGIVLHFLIRQEPFTSMAIDLQSGRFDCPDRLFFDVGESWNGCLTGTSDMKELIPEFYCLPEMFLNTNNFPLGTTQSERVVHNVGLPPWAKDSAYEFVRINRLALESEYVTQHLHHWIDLIFGYKQRGEEAEAAHNIFHHLSYEGSVDLDKITDEVDRNAAESHIQNFGQTPSQLIVEDPHPTRYSADTCWSHLIHEAASATTLRCHTPSKQFANRRSEHARGAVLKLHVLSDSITAIYADMSVGTYRWLPNSRSNRLRMDRLRPFVRRELSTSRVAMKRGSAISPEEVERSSLSIGNWSFAVTLGGLVKEELRRNASVSSGRIMTTGELSMATAESSALIVSCGYWDETVKVHNSDASRLMASETGGHQGAIRCLAIGQDGALMVTGGQDCTARVWVVDHPDMSIALSDGYVQTALGGSNEGDQLLSCCHVLWGHDSPIVAVDLDSTIDAVVTGSQSGFLCVHTIRRGEFIRSFRPPPISSKNSVGSVSKVALGTQGHVIIHMEDKGLHAYTINSVRLCSVDATEHLYDIKVCTSDEILVTGGERCQVIVRQLTDLQVCAMLDLSRHGPIRCIAFTPSELNPIKQFLFIGSDDGMITIVDEDPLIQQKRSTRNAF